MNAAKAIPVRLISPLSQETLGTAYVQEWDSKARMKRAVKSFAMSWGAAIVSVLIPLAHFVLVPAFLIAGPLLFYVVIRQTSAVLGGDGPCPSCGKPFKIAKARPSWPLKDVCSECYNSVSIEPVS